MTNNSICANGQSEKEPLQPEQSWFHQNCYISQIEVYFIFKNNQVHLNKVRSINNPLQFVSCHESPVSYFERSVPIIFCLLFLLRTENSDQKSVVCDGGQFDFHSAVGPALACILWVLKWSRKCNGKRKALRHFSRGC